ncbi:glycerophosphoryl diester phosphodiesterase [Nitrospirillum amazonense]|uniref:glycerophosphoryl diester phosphodiesterase n=1 Tax=Nitrospirillum amazonense TaxID=28077 RepID=UPI002412C708|nr:glycerophosphoryl diester phosphodiesterase [Nitrospirillum amazonense]MDG3440292.1 glycerophosphoryl diester phosphodiesterase [Nitrospirillum amazonense]
MSDILPLGPLPRLIGHRGAARHAPENTLSGIRMAATQGAKWVEVDVKLTADLVPVLMHDDDLDRTTDGKGPAKNLTLDALRQLDAGSWFSPAFRGEKVPTLVEVIQLVLALNLGLNLEIKPCPGREEETAGVALTLAYSLWPDDRPPPLVSSFADASLDMARQVVPRWPLGYLIDRRPANWRQRVEQLNVSTINVNARREDAASIREYKSTGRPVLAYTVNTVPMAREVLGWGVSSVFTDTPSGLMEIAG